MRKILTNKITPEKTHALLEKLAEYVMNEVPTRQEMNQRFEGIDQRFESIEQRFEGIDQSFKGINFYINRIDDRLEKLEIDVKETKTDVKTILEGMDAEAKELEIARLERTAISRTLDRHEQNITKLEQNRTGYRINDKEELYPPTVFQSPLSVRVHWTLRIENWLFICHLDFVI